MSADSELPDLRSMRAPRSGIKREFQRLLAMLRVATARVSDVYFQLPVADADAVYRERVYSYELYHQLRCIWGDFPFCLGGEIAKTGHPHFQDGPYARAKPDFLVHAPGSMDQNLAVIEVKPATVAAGGIREDLRKLTWFCRNAHYFRGVFLVYGEAGELKRQIKSARAAADDRVEWSRLSCLHHRRVGEQATEVRT